MLPKKVRPADAAGGGAGNVRSASRGGASAAAPSSAPRPVAAAAKKVPPRPAAAAPAPKRSGPPAAKTPVAARSASASGTTRPAAVTRKPAVPAQFLRGAPPPAPAGKRGAAAARVAVRPIAAKAQQAAAATAAATAAAPAPITHDDAEIPEIVHSDHDDDVAAAGAASPPSRDAVENRDAVEAEDEDELMLSDDDENVFLFPEDAAEELRGGGTTTTTTVELGGMQAADDESDSSEDEATLNRVGDIPLEWYKDTEHYGYDVEGRKLLKKERSALERLLGETDDPNAFRTIYDALHDERKVLTNADLQIIFNLQRNRAPNPNADLYEDYPESTLRFDPLNHPLARGHGPSKKKFTPALHDMKRIAKMVKRMLKAPDPTTDDAQRAAKDDEDAEAERKSKLYMLWDDAGNVEMDSRTKFKYFNRIEKPKVIPPGTFESYRPPPEYIPSATTKERFLRLRRLDRKEHFLPEAFGALRHVPFYHHTIQDRYQRCLDLTAFPRKQRTRLVVDPNKLLPELPDPKDLRPYPERLSFLYKGHTATVRSISLTPNGEYLATGCDDHMVRVYEVQTGRLMKRYDLGAPVQQVAFSPSTAHNILACAIEYAIVFVVPAFCAHEAVNEHTIRFLRAPGHAAQGSGEHMAGGEVSASGGAITQTIQDADETAFEGTRDLHDTEEKEKRAEFLDANAKERRAGIVLKVTMHAKVKTFNFHARGDYMCALCPKDHVKYRQTIMLQLSKRKVFCPFRKFGEVVTACRFHPREPQFFLATTNSVRCYNLLAHRLQKKYKAPGGVTTSIDVHPGGDNFIVGDTTNHTSWYDVDFSDKPYKRMRSHKGVTTAVAFHGNTDAYPLFASGAADGQVHVFHGMVFDDYNKNALIVPVKILKHHRPVYAVCWHPTLPWVFTATEDGTVSCWTE